MMNMTNVFIKKPIFLILTRASEQEVCMTLKEEAAKIVLVIDETKTVFNDNDTKRSSNLRAN